MKGLLEQNIQCSTLRTFDRRIFDDEIVYQNMFFVEFCIQTLNFRVISFAKIAGPSERRLIEWRRLIGIKLKFSLSDLFSPIVGEECVRRTSFFLSADA